MLGVGSELASQSQRESARLEVQPLLDPNKHTSEVQANQRNDHTTDNDEYESVSVIERPLGPLPESNMISESIPAARDLSLEPKQSKNSPTCPLTESNFYKNLVETLQKYPLEWNSTVQVSQDRLMNKNTNGASISEQNNHENIDQTIQRLQNTLINVAGATSSTREQQGTLQSSQQSDGTTSSYTKPLNIDILQQVQQMRRITIKRNPVPLHHAEQIQQQEPIPQPSATNQPTTTTDVPMAPTIPEPADLPVVNNQPTALQPPQPAVPQTASNNSTAKKFQCSECNIEPCSFPTLKGLYGHAHSLTNHPTHPHHPEKIAEQYRTAINALHCKAQCRICGSPFSTKGNCTTHEKQTPYCREKIKEMEQHVQSNPTLTAAPPANVQLPDYDCYTLSRFCSNTDKLALDKAYNQLHDDFIRSKIETPSHIDRFIGQFKLKESKPNKHTVFLEEDEQIKIRKLRSAVSREFALQATGKAFQRLEDHYDNVPRVLITEQEALEEFKRKHPDSKNLQFPPLPAGIVMQGQMDPITEDEIKTIILRIKKAKSPGEDGITGNT
ncbi:Putative_reverse transcriptase/endonuclease [Hexamita inflata]|uniref:Reverse transcriptase/endonuclease n=1 Tax=Hexamita inflata TaxID=28002 RepID=A0AA86QF24_9EUKA|nr:Putative reverse transcriptase/endonuclease [Hexamita inflata]